MNEYAQLIKRVAKVNRHAALWMARKAPLFMRRRIITLREPGVYYDGGILHGAFVFERTPQGFKYWDEIATQLGEW